MESKELKNKNKEILLEVALTLNKELFNENKISYKMFKYTEDNILKELKLILQPLLNQQNELPH